MLLMNTVNQLINAPFEFSLNVSKSVKIIVLY